MDAADRCLAGTIVRPAGLAKTTSAAARLCACLFNVNRKMVIPTVARSTTAAEPRIAAPPARIQVGPASTTCVWVVPTVSELPVRHSAAEPTAALSAMAAEERSTVPRPAPMATRATKRTPAARARMAGLRRHYRRPSRHRRAPGLHQRRPRCRPSEHRGRLRCRRGQLAPRHRADFWV
jgi:hypothetical protein